MRQLFHLNLASAMSKARWKVAGAFVRPNGIRTNSYRPWWVVNAVFGRSASQIGICQKPELASTLEKTSASPRESTLSSMRGMGYWSRTVILFKRR